MANRRKKRKGKPPKQRKANKPPASRWEALAWVRLISSFASRVAGELLFRWWKDDSGGSAS